MPRHHPRVVFGRNEIRRQEPQMGRARSVRFVEKGFFPKAWLQDLRTLGSPLQGHPANALLDGIEASTGSLGQGLSVAQGIALAGQLRGSKQNPAHRVYVILGDGEMQEGQVWEAALSAPHLGVTNLCAFVDHNKAQIDGTIDEVMPLGDLVKKWSVAGWQVLRINGHDFSAIRGALTAARKTTDRPTLVVADTIKGKGVSFMENDIVGWHGKTPTVDECTRALAELDLQAPKGSVGGAS
jgi:transketolase